MKTQGMKMTTLACGLAGLMGTATMARANNDQPSKGTAQDMADPGSDETTKELGEVPPTVPPTANVDNGDPTWTAVKLHRLNLMEIQASQAEQAKGLSPQVKSLASHIARDHQMADRQLAAYAKKHKISLKGTESPKANVDYPGSADDNEDLRAESDLRQLKAHKGRDMDQAFLTAMITGHDRAIALVRAVRVVTKDSDLANLLDGLLPSLQSHRDQAATLNNAINGTSSR